MKRRQFLLSGVGTAAPIVTAGCLEQFSDSPTITTSATTTTTTTTTTRPPVDTGKVQVYNFQEKSVSANISISHNGTSIFLESITLKGEHQTVFEDVFEEDGFYEVVVTVDGDEKKSETIQYTEKTWMGLKISFNSSGVSIAAVAP